MPPSNRTPRRTSSSYYDLQNSDVYHVFARRKGIPITLSVLYVAIARRAGIELTMQVRAASVYCAMGHLLAAS